MRILAIIPARGGSKGVPGKNSMNVEGKPLLAYSIEVAQACSEITSLLVNTEDEKIESIAKKYDCHTFKRDKKLATDKASVVDVVLENIYKLEEKDLHFDAVLLLQPTAPLRTPQDIKNSIQLLKNNPRAEAVISMIKVEDNHPARMYRANGKKAKSFMPELETKRRQDLPELYLRNGCIYLIKIQALKEQKTFMPLHKVIYEMDANWAVNVDTEIDVILLKELVRKWKNR